MRTILTRVQSLVLVFLFLPNWNAHAQQAPPPKDTGASQTGKSEATQSKRIFGVIPAFEVSDSANVPPLTSREKFHLAWRTSIDPFAFAGSAVKAGVYQGADLNPEFGQGFSGFAKRFGASYADGTSGLMFGTFLFPTLLHQDPRYFRKAEGSFSNRLGYSITRIFITRTDGGARAFNWSKTLGGLASGGLSNAYYPVEDRGVKLTIGNFAWSMGAGALSNTLKEFWPDIQRRFFKKKQTTGQPAP
ncbi:MAG: hypothetical protein LAO31_00045 [Acidobacteriia bacterium]|nr:hypothetical protein [Terriglobia bacterium]